MVIQESRERMKNAWVALGAGSSSASRWHSVALHQQNSDVMGIGPSPMQELYISYNLLSDDY
jgi:hypothetical protein